MVLEWLWLVTALVLLPLVLLTRAAQWKKAFQRWRRLIRSGNQIPGPCPWPLIGNAFQLGLDPTKFLKIGREMWKKYGPVFRLWAGSFHLIVLLIDPRDAEVLLTSSKNLKKPFIYSFLKPWLGEGLLTSSGKKWHMHRKIITPAFHFKILEQFIEIFIKQGDICISLLKEREGGQPFDITPLISRFTQDVICESAMGVEVHAQTQGDKVPYVKAVKRMCDILSQRAVRPWLYPEFIYQLTSSGREEKINLKIIQDFTNEVIKRRREFIRNSQRGKNEQEIEDEIGSKKKLAFLDLLLNSEEGENLSHSELRNEVDTFMFAGHDTTASALSFCLMELSRRPDIQEKVINELKQFSNDDLELALSMENLNKMKYLEQVIKETLRLYPSVPLYGRELTEELKLVSLPVTLQPGTFAIVSPGIMHHHSEYYREADEFDPENFNSDAISKRPHFAYLPFSAGSRNCIGQKFAMLEMKTTLAKIVWNFILQIDPNYKLVLVPEVTLQPKYGVKLSLNKRSNR